MLDRPPTKQPKLILLTYSYRDFFDNLAQSEENASPVAKMLTYTRERSHFLPDWRKLFSGAALDETATCLLHHKRHLHSVAALFRTTLAQQAEQLRKNYLVQAPKQNTPSQTAIPKLDLQTDMKVYKTRYQPLNEIRYQVERDIKDKPAAYRLAMRRRKSMPLTKQLRKIIVNAKDKFPPTHDITKAMKYTLNHWIALTRFLKNPDIAIDNNESERAIKSWVLVRKNSLFAGSDAGACAIATHLSFISSAKRNGINSVDWYADVQARINEMKTSELQQLLPHRWSPPSPPNPLLPPF
ncbi:MAG: transposase [Candidatus Obscuribacter sp.]|nr:transposase [Candidatus Obscuribacter sp.]